MNVSPLSGEWVDFLTAVTLYIDLNSVSFWLVTYSDASQWSTEIFEINSLSSITFTKMNSDSETEELIQSSESDEEFSSSESDSDEDCLDDVRDWCALDSSTFNSPPPRFTYTGDPGIKIPIINKDYPLEYFSFYFNDEVLSFIVNETNRYADNYFENTDFTPSSRALDWNETNKDEILCFLALLLLQGVVQKPVEKWFWSKRPTIATAFFWEIMTERRYALIMRFRHFENNDTFDAGTHPNPKLRKIF